MYYFLLFNSSLIINNYSNQKLILVLTYGSILYMISHAIIFHTNIPFLIVLRSYFWNLFMLDIMVLVYKLWGSENITPNENLKLSINLLKNKIYNMMDAKHNINIEDQNLNSNSNYNTNTNNTNNNDNNDDNYPNISQTLTQQQKMLEQQTTSSNLIQNQTNNFSTPINKIKQIQNNNQDINIQQESNNHQNIQLLTQSQSQPLKNNFNNFPSSPLVYNPHIDIPKAEVQHLPPPQSTKKGFNNEYNTPSEMEEQKKQIIKQNTSSNLKYGFSSTNDTLDINKLLDENQSIASDVASMIDLEGF